MKALSVRQSDDIAQHKLLLIRQQALVAELFRSGQKERARAARNKLYQLLNKLDLLEQSAGKTSETSGKATLDMPDHVVSA